MVTYMKMYGYKINDNVSNACTNQKSPNGESILGKDFKGVRVDALAISAEEGRGKLR